DFELTDPASAIRQRDFHGVMARLELKHAHVIRRRTFRAAVDTDRHAAGVGRKLERAVLNSLLRIGGSGRRGADNREGQRNHGRDGKLEHRSEYEVSFRHHYTSAAAASLAAFILA